MLERHKFVCVLASSLDGSRKLMYNNAVHIGYSNSNIGYFQVLPSKRCKVPGRVLGQTFYFPSNFTIQKCFFEAKFVKIHRFNSTFNTRSVSHSTYWGTLHILLRSSDLTCLWLKVST